MNNFGLSDKNLKLIISTLAEYKEIELVKIFGSRALETYKNNSDIDLAIYGNLDLRIFARLITELNELPIPYKLDIVLYNKINNPNLTQHIDQHGKKFYLPV